MRVFLDTNVWLAARFGRGLCAELLELLVANEAELLVDAQVLSEFRRIAANKFGVPEPVLRQAERFFAEFVTLVPSTPGPLAGVADPDDAPILAAALAAGADLFVTGDKALVALGAVEGMPVVDPRAAYLKLRELA